MTSKPPATSVPSATVHTLPTLPGQADRLLRELEWKVIRRLDGLLQGDYRTLMRGAGLDLTDLREYQPHDDVRHIDWNVTARLNTPHVRVFTEDREMSAWFLLDLSPSISFGPTGHAKRDILTGFVAVLSRLLTRHGNRVGAVLYGGASPQAERAVDAVLPPRSSRDHVLHLVHKLLPSKTPVPPHKTGAAPPNCTGCCRPAWPRSSAGPPYLWCPTSSAHPAGKSPWPSWPRGMTWWPCACSTRWSWSCPTWA